MQCCCNAVCEDVAPRHHCDDEVQHARPGVVYLFLVGEGLDSICEYGMFLRVRAG